MQHKVDSEKSQRKAITEAGLNLPAVESGVSVEHPKNPLPMITISQLSPLQKEACERADWNSLTPVQSLAIPYLEAGRDLTVQSRTGSGKTGSYLLPMLSLLDPKLKTPQALVLVPTRELASQVEREAKTLFGDSGLKACAIYGGVGYHEQLLAIKAGAQVIIGTPGRVLDLLIKNQLNFNHLKELVFDEADRMLSIGFYPDILQIASYLPTKRHTTLFSATYPPHVMQLAKEFMHNPEMLSLSRKELSVPEVEHLFAQVRPFDKDRALVRLIETENPSSAIIFCNTKVNVHYVTELLKSFGYKAEEISADLPQKKREAVLAKARKGDIRYLVATDVAARGIDIPQLSHVFLYEPPGDQEIYIHRAGRTGRAGAAGTVISIVDPMQRLNLERIAHRYKVPLRQIPVPTDEAVARATSDRLDTILEDRLRHLTGLERERASRYMPLAKELTSLSGEEDGEHLSIIAMLLDDFHRQMLHGNRYPISEVTEFRRPIIKSSKPGGSRRKPQGRRTLPAKGAKPSVSKSVGDKSAMAKKATKTT